MNLTNLFKRYLSSNSDRSFAIPSSVKMTIIVNGEEWEFKEYDLVILDDNYIEVFRDSKTLEVCFYFPIQHISTVVITREFLQ